MKKSNIIWIAVLILVIAAQWTIHEYDIFTAKAKVTELSHNHNSVPGQKGEKTGEGTPMVDFYYTCGMHPDIKEPEPGICPICNMNLVRKNISSSGTPGQVQIDPVTIQNMGIRTADVEKRRLSRSIRAAGVVTYDESRIKTVTAKVSGWAENVFADITGQYIKKGSPLLEIYSPDLVATQEEYIHALKYDEEMKKASHDFASNQSAMLLASTKKRLRLWDISNRQIDNLKRTKSALKTMTLYSPVSGIVVNKGIEKGGRIKSEKQLFKIASISKVWVLADIYEYEVPWIKTGQKTVMKLPYLPGKEFEGKITYIYPYLNSRTRTVKVRCEFDNPGMELKPDMYANLIIKTDSGEPVTAVPVSAVLKSGERNTVILDTGDGKFEPRDIKTGIESDEFYAVTDGLTPGDRVVTSAHFLIDSESRLREAQHKMTAPAEEQKKVKTTVTLIGSGEMNYTCPMPEDMVFSSGRGDCEECGMKLKEMTEKQKKHLENLKKNHKIEQFKDFEEYKKARGNQEAEEEHEHQIQKHDEKAEDKHQVEHNKNEVEAEEKHQVEHDKDHGQQEGKEDNQTVLYLGKGEMTHFCPMKEDLVFSSSAGRCPRCGMKLRKMKPENIKNMEKLIGERDIIRIPDREKVTIDVLDEYMSFTERSVILVGSGEMEYTCPANLKPIFSSTEIDCPFGDMKLKTMMPEQKKRLEKLLKESEFIRLKSAKDIIVEKGGM